MKSRMTILGILGLGIFLISCSSNPITRAKDVPSRSIVPTKSNVSIGKGIDKSKFVSGSHWEYEYGKSGINYIVIPTIEIDRNYLQSLDENIKRVSLTLNFLVRKPEYGDIVDLNSNVAFIRYEYNGKKSQTMSEVSAQKWLKAIIDSDSEALSKMISLSLPTIIDARQGKINNSNQGNTQKTITIRGIPAYFQEAKMAFLRLEDKNGVEIAFLGAPFEFDNNQQALACLDAAQEKRQQVELTGQWVKKGEEIFGFDLNTLTCKLIQ